MTQDPSRAASEPTTRSGGASSWRRLWAGGRRPRYMRGKVFSSKERGIALVMVMIAISIVLAITNQFATNATIDMMAAANYRDQMRAHFLARTALDVSELVIRIQRGLEGRIKGVDLTTYADQLMMAFCGNRSEISEVLGVPADRIEGLGSEIGNCGLTPAISTDDARINLNCAENQTVKESLRQRLAALLAFTAYDPVFNEEDAEGWRRDRDTQVRALMDYIDKDSGSEDYGYESLRDAYKAKNAYLDTVGEIKQIRGVDDRFWALFGSSFTVYGGCKLNVAAVDNVALMASTLQFAAENANDPLLRDQRRLWLLASIIIKAREFGITQSKLEDFISFVKDPLASFGTGSSKSGSSASTSPAASLAASLGLAPGEKIGLALSKSKLETIAAVEKKRTYRVTAWGEINRAQVDDKGNPIFPPVRRTITGVWDFNVTPQNRRKPSRGATDSGAWVFLKEQ